MNKKKLVLSAAAFVVFAMSANNVYAATCCQQPTEQKMPPPVGMDNPGGQPAPFRMDSKSMEKMKHQHEKRKAEMDARLKLTDEQKCIIEKNRQDARQKMKPIFDEMRAKKMKLNEIYSSNLSQTEKESQMKALKSQINDLRMNAHKLREENMKNFESVLTPAQKVEFDKMKQEHRKERGKKIKNLRNQMSQPPCKN